MLGFGIFMLVSLHMECSCIAPLTSVVMVMRGLVFHPLLCIVSISESYLICLYVRAWSRNLSWQYVNLMNWTTSLGEGEMGVCVWFGAPNMHRISGLNLAWHWHVVYGHVHLRNHSGIVCSSGLLLRLHVLVSVKNLVCLLACSVWVWLNYVKNEKTFLTMAFAKSKPCNCLSKHMWESITKKYDRSRICHLMRCTMIGMQIGGGD